MSRPDPGGVAARLRHLRERLGLTRTELEEALRARGVRRCSAMTIRRNESGTRSPALDEVAALAALTGVPMSWIVEGGTPMADSEAGERELVRALLEAELMRASGRDRRAAAQEAFARAETRLGRLRASGSLGEAGWSHWLALREGAVLSGGYAPET